MMSLKRLGIVACLVGLCVARAEEPLRLTFITCAVEAKFFEPVKQGMNDAAEMLGRGVTAHADVVNRDCEIARESGH